MAWLSLNRKFGLFWWNIATLAIPGTTVPPAVPVRPLPTGRTDPEYFMTQPRQRTIFHAPPLALTDSDPLGPSGNEVGSTTQPLVLLTSIKDTSTAHLSLFVRLSLIVDF
jgi:hypothetical protein